jgi:hypothetical protein
MYITHKKIQATDMKTKDTIKNKTFWKRNWISEFGNKNKKCLQSVGQVKSKK